MNLRKPAFAVAEISNKYNNETRSSSIICSAQCGTSIMVPKKSSCLEVLTESKKKYNVLMR